MSGSTKISLLGSSAKVRMQGSGRGIVINPPSLTPDNNQLAYVFRISNILN